MEWYGFLNAGKSESERIERKTEQVPCDDGSPDGIFRIISRNWTLGNQDAVPPYFRGQRGSFICSVCRPKEAVSNPRRGWFFAYIPLSFRAGISG